MAETKNETLQSLNRDKFLRLLTSMAGDPARQPLIQHKELIDVILPQDRAFFLDREALNRLLSYYGFNTVTESFFQLFFGGIISSFEDFQKGVEEVRKKSMLYFGNFYRGFQTLAKWRNVAEFLDGGLKVPNLKSHPRKLRPTLGIQRLTPEQAYALGYTTSSSLSPEELNAAKKIGRTNAELFLSMLPIDIYVAASMREMKDFENAQVFLDQVFKTKEVRELGLNYFNPLVAFLDDSTQKGLMENLMLMKASTMIYLAGFEDTFGKDVELAAMLTQGKPVLVYVPKTAKKRQKLFHKSHPLRLQVEVATGIAHGVIVVDSAEQCASLLCDLFTHSLDTDIEEDGYNYYLCDRRTRSQIRVVTKNEYLTSVFWDYWSERE